jgi:hypothetical protein
MLIEFGNHNDLRDGNDERPKVTQLFIPEFDDGSNHPDGKPTGGYTHEPGLSVKEFVDHVQGAILNRQRIFNLPEHEILLAATQEAWRYHASPQGGLTYIGGDSALRPAWVKVTSHEQLHGSTGDMNAHDDDACQDVENFLRDYYELPDSAEKPADVEDRYWTRYGAPGEQRPAPTGGEMLFTNDGRNQQALNYGGGQVGSTGTGTAAGATSLTTNQTYTTNQWTGYRVYAMQTATGPLVWGNIISNTNAAGASVLTVDRWYVAATPGGAAATTPSAGFYYMIADGGMASAWFVGMTITNITPAATDHTMSGEYIVGSPTGVTSSAGYLRKIAPFAITQGTSPLTFTLTPVFTGVVSQDIFPQTFYAIGVFTSMLSTFGGTNGPMKFETSLNASATVAAAGDQITVTETVTGS